MKKLIDFSAIYLMVVFIGNGHIASNSLINDEPEPYFLTIGSLGGGFMFINCYEWNAIHVVEKRFNLILGSNTAGCFGIEGSFWIETGQQNERVNHALQQAGLLSDGETVHQVVNEEFRRQFQLDTLVRQHAFFRQAEERSGPVFIKSEPLESIDKFEISFFQEDENGQMIRVNQAYVDLSTLVIKLLNTDSVPANYPWYCNQLL